MSFCICLPNFVYSRTIGGGVMTSYPFFKMAAGNHIGFDVGILLDHPQSAIVDLSLVLKFGLDQIYYSFGDIAIFIFCGFGLFCMPVHAHFVFWGAGLGECFPQIWPTIVLTPKGPFMREKTSFLP